MDGWFSVKNIFCIGCQGTNYLHDNNGFTLCAVSGHRNSRCYLHNAALNMALNNPPKLPIHELRLQFAAEVFKADIIVGCEFQPELNVDCELSFEDIFWGYFDMNNDCTNFTTSMAATGKCELF